MQRRAAGLHGVGHRGQRLLVGFFDRIGQDEPEVDVADQGAEAAVGQAAEGVGGDEPVAQDRLVLGHRLLQDSVAVGFGRAAQNMTDGR